MNLNYVGLAGAVVALIVAFVALGQSPERVIVEKDRPVGVASGPDRFTQFESRNGINQQFERAALKTATSTPWAVQVKATSTLVNANCAITTASSTATIWRFARHSTAFATSTQSLASYSLGSGALGSFALTATSTSVDGNTIFRPGDFLVVGLEGTALADTTKLNGRCQATFEQI